MKIYLFEHEDENGIGLMALDECADLVLPKTYAPDNKITQEFVSDIQFSIGLEHCDEPEVRVVYVKDPDSLPELVRLYKAWELGEQVQPEQKDVESLTEEEYLEMRGNTHLCQSCVHTAVCHVAKAIECTEDYALPVISACQTYIPLPDT